MSYQQLQLVCDSSTLANYKAWAKPISDWMRTIGYTNTTDTGQLNGAGGGTGGSAGWSALAAAPGSAVYFYEIFETNDSFTRFFVKLEYGNISGTNCPSIAVTVGTGTNGAGQLTGAGARIQTNWASFTAPSTTLQYECNFFGDSTSSTIAIMMWRNGTNFCQQLFAIERSINASGSYTSTYVTVWTAGTSDVTSYGVRVQQTLHFSNGPGVLYGPGTTTADTGTWCARPTDCGSTSQVFNNNIPFDTPSPSIGYYDFPCTVVGVTSKPDTTEGATFQVTNQYGATLTYLGSFSGPFAYSGYGSAANFALAVRTA